MRASGSIDRGAASAKNFDLYARVHQRRQRPSQGCGSVSLHHKPLSACGRSIRWKASSGDAWQFKTKPIPWSRIRDWNCIACGECCKHFWVPISQDEWRTIVEFCGLGFTTVIDGKPHLRSTVSGRCIFQAWIQGRWLCTLQGVKPLVCKLWPFRITSHPKHGDPDSALFVFRRRQIFVYCDPRCSGVSLGRPSLNLVNRVIPEFVAMALGEKPRQRFSTAQTNLSPPVSPFDSLYRSAAPVLALDALIPRRASGDSLPSPEQSLGISSE